VFTPDGTQIGWAAENQFNVGLQAGGQGKKILLVFANADTLEQFKQGLLTGKVEGMAVAADKGATGTDSFHNGVAVYVGAQKGLMAGGMVGMENFRYRALGKEDEDPK
jgi:lipid-binding SYLF domain-containing protein